MWTDSLDCTCADSFSLCPLHHERVKRITIQDVLDGCTCRLVELFGESVVFICVTCPVHGAPAYREGRS